MPITIFVFSTPQFPPPDPLIGGNLDLLNLQLKVVPSARFNLLLVIPILTLQLLHLDLEYFGFGQLEI